MTSKIAIILALFACQVLAQPAEFGLGNNSEHQNGEPTDFNAQAVPSAAPRAVVIVNAVTPTTKRPEVTNSNTNSGIGGVVGFVDGMYHNLIFGPVDPVSLVSIIPELQFAMARNIDKIPEMVNQLEERADKLRTIGQQALADKIEDFERNLVLNGLETDYWSIFNQETSLDLKALVEIREIFERVSPSNGGSSEVPAALPKESVPGLLGAFVLPPRVKNVNFNLGGNVGSVSFNNTSGINNTFSLGLHTLQFGTPYSRALFEIVTEIQVLALRNVNKIPDVMDQLKERADNLRVGGRRALADKIEDFVINLGSNQFVPYCQAIVNQGTLLDQEAFVEIRQIFRNYSQTNFRNFGAPQIVPEVA